MGKKNKARRKRKLAQKAARKKRSRTTSKAGSLAPTIHTIPNPFAGLSDEQRLLAIEEVATKSEQLYQEALSELRNTLAQHNPLLVLSIMASYGLTAPVDQATGVTKLDSDCDLYPFHVEILQALSLQIDPTDLSGAPFGPDVPTQVRERIKTLCDAHNFRRLAPDGADLPDDEKTVALAQQLIRANTQAVRNWGYHSQIKAIARELYCPFDTQLLRARGFSASDVLNVFEKIVTETESRQTARHQKLADLLRSSGSDPRLLAKNYHALIGLESEDAERFVERLNLDELPFDVVWSMVLSHYDLSLPAACTFSASDLAASLGLDDERVAHILDDHALSWGGLRAYETEHLHLSNPVWERPLIRMGDREYFCALPATFFSFVIPCMEALLSPFAVSVSDRRAKYLETKVAEIVQRRFPGSTTRRNFKWVDDGRTYETDLITFIDSFALVIECKSGKITPSALRGAPDRLRKHIQELLIDPNLQSLRLKKRLDLLAANPTATHSIRDDIEYDINKVHKVVRASVLRTNKVSASRTDEVSG